MNIGIELVADRLLLCLDEPDAGLDPASKRELFTILRDLAHKRDKSVIVIIHDVAEIALFDKVIMMAKIDNVGRLAFFRLTAGCKTSFWRGGFAGRLYNHCTRARAISLEIKVI